MPGVTEWAVKPRLVSTCLAGRVERAAQHDEGVREIVAAELARIEGDLDRGDGRAPAPRTSSSSASSQRSRRSGRLLMARVSRRGRAGEPVGAAPRLLGPLGERLAAAPDQADRFGHAENHKGTAKSSAAQIHS